MEDKLVKKMIYMTIILFIFVLISFVFAKKSTSNLKREQELVQQKIAEQESRYNQQSKDDTVNQSTQSNEANRDVSQYIEENPINIDQQNSSNNVEIDSEKFSTVNQPTEQKTVEITKLLDRYTQDGYAIVKDFEINSTKFAIISKMSEYQGEYSKTTKKKYYIYKYIEQKLYEAAYIMELSIPKDKEGHGADVFTINQNGNNIEINIDILPNTSRLYHKQKLLSFPHTAVNVLEIEFQKNK